AGCRRRYRAGRGRVPRDAGFEPDAAPGGTIVGTGPPYVRAGVCGPSRTPRPQAGRKRRLHSPPIATRLRLRLRARRPRSAFRLQVFLQRDGIVVLRVARAIDERHDATPRRGKNRLPRVRTRVELAEIARAKLGPLPRIVVEPLPEFRARSGVLEPGRQ